MCLMVFQLKADVSMANMLVLIILRGSLLEQPDKWEGKGKKQTNSVLIDGFSVVALD